jgi:hypothetical protein
MRSSSVPRAGLRRVRLDIGMLDKRIGLTIANLLDRVYTISLRALETNAKRVLVEATGQAVSYLQAKMSKWESWIE